MGAGETYVFVALSGVAFGEITLGRRIAAALVARGERVIFVAPQAAWYALEGRGFECRPAEGILADPLGELQTLVLEVGARSIILIDVTAVLTALEAVGLSGEFLGRLDVPVVALDIWSLPETDLGWDHGDQVWPLPPLAASLPLRLTPVPFARPEAPCAYRALPEASPASSATRAAVRRELGVAAEEPLVLIATSRWQTPEVQVWPHARRLARALPVQLMRMLGAVRPVPLVLHVGPQPFDAGPLGGRYRTLSALPPGEFERLVSACDAVVSFNASATSTLMALATLVPVLLMQNSHAGRGVAELEADLGCRLTDETSRWLADLLPLHRFRVWPLGLFGLLEPVLRDNPFLGAVRSVEILAEDAFAVACGELISAGAARDEARSAEARYCERVRTLPTAAEVLLAQLP